MKLNFSAILSHMDDALALANKFAAFVPGLGPAAKIIEAATEFGQNTLTNASDLQLALTSNDQAVLQERIRQARARGDEIDAQIDAEEKRRAG